MVDPLQKNRKFKGNLALRIAVPALVATLLAIIIASSAFFFTYNNTEKLSREVRLHDESLIALESMQTAAHELQNAMHLIVDDGDPVQVAALEGYLRKIQEEHDRSLTAHQAAEVGNEDAHDAAHQEQERLYQECNEIHQRIDADFRGLMDQGLIAPGVGAQGIDGAQILREINAEFNRMYTTDQEINNLLEADREKTIGERQEAQATAKITTVIAGALALFAGIAVAFVSSRKLVRPVRELARAAAQIESGDFSQRVEASGSNELARLGGIFNKMANSLEARTRQLEHEQASIRSIHQSIGDGLVVLDDAGVIVSLNPAAENALGKSALELEGKTDIGIPELQRELERPPLTFAEMNKCWEVKQCTHPECPSYESSDRRCWLQCGTSCHNQIQGTFRQKRDACERCEVFQTNAVRQFELTIEERRFSVAILPVLDDQGQQEGRTLVLHDISDIYNARLELEKHSTELEELQGLANAVTRTLDLDATLEAGAKMIYQGGNHDVVAVFLADNNRGGWSLASLAGFNGVPAQKIEDLQYLDRTTIPARALQSREPIIIDDLHRFKRLPQSLRELGMLSAAIVPMVTDESSILGLLCAGKRKAGAFSSDDARMLKLMAAQLSIAAKNSLLYEDRVRYSERMLARNRIIETLTSSLLFEDVFDTFADQVRKLVHYDHMSVMLVDKSAANIEMVTSGEGCPLAIGEDMPLAGSSLEWIIEHKQPVMRGDLRNQLRFNRDDILVDAGVLSCLNMPLIVKNKVIGTLNFCSNSKSFYSKETVDELRPTANQLALALANQDLFRHVAKAKAEWEATFDAVGEGIVVVDEQHVIVRLNRAAADMLGSTVEELTGESCRERLHRLLTGGDGPCVLVSPEPDMTPVRSETELEDGRTLEFAIDPVFDETGRFIGGVHFMRDVTEAKQMRQRLLTSEKMVAVGQLVSGVAHEINNPLTGITGYAQLMMMRDDIDDKIRQDAEAIAHEADRATRIVRQLLSFARKHQPERQLISINEIIRDCVGLKGYDLKVNNIDIRMELDENLPDVAIDRHQIQQVFINLITNAEQAIHENGKAGSLEIISTMADDKIRVLFTDNGTGMTEAVRSRLFDPFFTTKEVGKGTGLGLSVCYGIVQEHQGSIWAEEAPGGAGARFVVELPTDTPATFPGIDDRGPAAALTGRILLVDDERPVREVLTETLRRNGHRVDAAANGEEALELLGNNDYDCIISDVKMPVMTGAELHLAVRSINPEVAARFIFISGDTVNEETRRYLENVASPSLSKPFSLQDLEAELQKMLAGTHKAA